jgi:hypothetical protein
MFLAPYAPVLRLKALAGNPELGCLYFVLAQLMSAVLPVKEQLCSGGFEDRRETLGLRSRNDGVPLASIQEGGISARSGTCSTVNGTVAQNNTAPEIVFGIDALQRTIGRPAG